MKLRKPVLYHQRQYALSMIIYDQYLHCKTLMTTTVIKEMQFAFLVYYVYLQSGLASCYNKQMVWFQKIYIPTPKMVIGKSEGEGVSKAKLFKGKYEAKLEN